MARYLDPKNDLVFKRVFGEHPHLLKSFLNALMPLEEGQVIENLEYLTPENVPKNPMQKYSIVDVRCQDNFGRRFIVEMQMEWSNFFPHRMLMNVTRDYSRQLNRGEHYKELQSVYGLGILNSIFDTKTAEFYHRYQMTNRKNIDETIDGIEIVMLELPKFKPETMEHKRMAVLWLRFLRETEDRITKISEELLANEDIQKALEICEESAYTEEELYDYERYWMEISTSKSLWFEKQEKLEEGLKKGLEEGLKKGLEEGLKKGLEEGIEKGLKKGLEEGIEKGREKEQQKWQQVLADKENELANKDKELAELRRLLNKA